MARWGGSRWLRVAAVAATAVVAAATSTAAVAAAASPSRVAAVVAEAEPAAVATSDLPAATKVGGAGNVTAAGDLPTAAKSSDSWCTYRVTCIVWFHLGRAIYDRCLPPVGSRHRPVARELMYSVLVDVYYAIHPRDCCFSGAKTDRIKEALSGVAPYIEPTCSVFSSRSARAGGREGGGRPTVGGEHPLANIVRTVSPAAPRYSGAAAADPAVADEPTTVRGADDDENEEEEDDDDTTAAEAAGDAAEVAEGDTTAASDAAAAASDAAAAASDAAAAASDAAAAANAASVSDAATAGDTARVVITSGGSCCTEYEEYEPYHTHPCCHVGCRIAAQFLPFITHDECCNFQHQRLSTLEWYYTNREGRYC